MQRGVRMVVAVTALVTLALAGLAPRAVSAQGQVYWVATDGNDSSGSGSEGSPFATVNRALSAAQAGDTVQLKPGTYFQDITTVRSGSSGSRITVTGPSTAIIKGTGQPRVVQVHHDYITLNGFTVDGQIGSDYSQWRDKLIYVIATTQGGDVLGLKIQNMAIKNGGGECLRLRYNTRGAEIANNQIGPCGQHDYPGGVWGGVGKNGEGIYIGTAPEQLGLNGAPPGPDASDNNVVRNNDFNTQGNECVDVKEGSSGNIIEYNDCTGQKDTESAGFDSRGNGNTFRYNKSFDNLGAGIRFGGDTSSDGLNNNAYYNSITGNDAGGIKFMRSPQGTICGNVMSGNTGGNSVGSFAGSFNPTTACPGSVPAPVGEIGKNGGGAPAPTATPTRTATPVPNQPTATPTRTATPVPNQPTATPTTAPGGGVSLGGGNTYVEAEAFSANSGGWRTVVGSTITYVEVPQGQGISGDAQLLSYQLNVQSSATYYIWLRIYGPDGSSDSLYTRMDSGTRGTLATEVQDAWHWKKLSGSFSLSAGAHTFKISNREDGTRVDRIFFTTSSSATP